MRRFRRLVAGAALMALTGASQPVCDAVLCRLAYDTPALPVGVAVLPACPAPPEDAVALYRAALAAGARAAGAAFCLVTAGPLLDGPDQVAAGPILRNGATLLLTVDHTSIRRSGGDVLRNVPWRPLLRLRLPALPPGAYALSVTWRAVTALDDRTPLQDGAETVSVDFTVAPPG